MTLFQKIVARQIPAKIISEDEDLIVFHDINPQAPIHVLVVPKKPIPRLAEARAEDGNTIGQTGAQSSGNGQSARNIADGISCSYQ